jgi:predicted carbohydrate-binding protein with CBM5 and CBM33 domain
MSGITERRRPATLRVLAAVATAAMMLLTTLSSNASAHGSVIDPPSRNYGCWDRWGADHLNPTMADTDPMCAQAFAANPNTMWNWNGLYRENVGGQHEAVIPNGQLCSGGLTQGGLYASLDAVGPWIMADKSNTFDLTLLDVAHHGADYLRVYVTKQGFDATTQPLTWADLEQVTETDPILPGPESYTISVSAPGRTGRHIVYTIWQASHLDQPYYICSDVNFV